MGTYSQACFKAKCVKVHASINSEADKNGGSEDEPGEERSVQDDREGDDNECFCGVCEQQNWSRKYGLSVRSNWYHTSCVKAEDNNIPNALHEL